MAVTPSRHGDRVGMGGDPLDLAIGRTLLWVVSGALLGYLAFGLVSGQGKVATAIGAVVGLVAGVLDFHLRRTSPGLRFAWLTPSESFAIAYPAAAISAGWGTHVRDFGVSSRAVEALAALSLLVVAPVLLVVVSRHVGRVGRAALLRRSAVVVTVAALALVVVGGVGLLLLPESLALWFAQRTARREAGEVTARGRIGTRVGRALGAVALLYLVLLVGIVAADPLGLGAGSPFDTLYQGATPPSPDSTLLIATPDLQPPMHLRTTGTAEAMDRRYPQYRFLRADQPSTGPEVVSVNVIDDYTWGAVARSKSGKCYAIVWLIDRSNPQYGGSKFGFIPTTRPCEARWATRATVTGDHW